MTEIKLERRGFWARVAYVPTLWKQVRAIKGTTRLWALRMCWHLVFGRN